MMAMLCFVGGPLLTNLEPDGRDVFTERETARDFPTTCFGMGPRDSMDERRVSA